MAITVKIPAILRGFTDRTREVPGRGATVRELIANLESDYPGIGRYLPGDDGDSRRSTNVFVNGENVRSLGGLATQICDGDKVSIVPSGSGG